MTDLGNAHRSRLSLAPAATGSLRISSVPTEPGRASVHLIGECDAGTADLIAAALDEQLALRRPFVRLDLSQVSFLDSAGLRTIVEAHDRFLYAGGTVVLTGVGPRVAHLLQITGLHEALFIADGPGEPPRARHLRVVGEETR